MEGRWARAGAGPALLLDSWNTPPRVPSLAPLPAPPPQDAKAPGFKEVSALVREPRPDMLLLPGLSTRM
jgi:hypothetical protein